MLVKDISTCKECPIYMKACSGNRDVLMSHCIEPPCVYLNADDDIEREVGTILRGAYNSYESSHEDDFIVGNN